MNLASVLLDVLADAGVRHLFGIPGDAINDLLQAVRKQDALRFVHVRHEESGALAASAQSKLTGGLGACAGTAGPGAIHLLNGLYDAKHDGASVIAITGQVERRFRGSNYHQEVDVEALFSDVAVFNETVASADQMPSLIVRACRAALARHGVAHVSVPADLMGARISSPRQRGQLSAPEVEIAPDPDAVLQAASLLNGSRRVAILAGAGCRGAERELIALATVLKAPVVRSLRAKDLLPDDHPLSLGGHGLLGTRPASDAIDRCDILLLAGTDFPYPDFYPDGAKVIQIDTNPERIGGRHPVDVGLVAHARPALAELGARIEPERDDAFLTKHQKAMEAWRETLRAREQDESTPLRPQHVARMVGELAPDDTVFACDTGAITVWCARSLPVREGSRFTLSGGLGTMGYGVPAAIGAKLAWPERPVVALVGDGSMEMLLGELLTAVRYRLPITVVVFTNRKLGLIQMEQEASGIAEYETSVPELDFAAFAKLCGAGGQRVVEADELRPALERAFATPGPFVVDVAVHPDELTLPPTLEAAQALGFLQAKVKEVLGMGDREAGLDPVRSVLRRP